VINSGFCKKWSFYLGGGLNDVWRLHSEISAKSASDDVLLVAAGAVAKMLELEHKDG
jgi:hypothetical protein